MWHTRNLNEYIDNLIWGHKWDNEVDGKTTITYSTDLEDWSYSSADYKINYGDDLNVYLLNDSQKKAMQQAFTNYSQIANLTFIDVGDTLGDDTDIVLRQADMGDLASAWAMPWYYEKNKITSFYNLKYDIENLTVAKDDILVNTKVTSFDKGDRGYFVFLHEIGHSLGLKHPHDGGGIGNDNLPYYLDNSDYTVMSYNSNMQYDAVNSDAMPISLQVLDILAIQELYGANMEHNADDNKYILDGSNSLDGNDYTGNLKNEYKYISETIWDAGGIDIIDSTLFNENVILDLREGFNVKTGEQYYSLVGETKIFIAFDAIIENASSGSGDDVIFGNEYNNIILSNDGNDIINAGDGNDIIYAGDGDDKIYGGYGNDIIYSGAGNDYIDAGKGNDIIYTDIGKNNIDASDGNDQIFIGKGSINNITGGKGYDNFIIQFNDLDINNSNYSLITIKDFNIEEDIINLESFYTYSDLNDLDLISNNKYIDSYLYQETQINLYQDGVSYLLVLEYIHVDNLTNDNFVFASA